MPSHERMGKSRCSWGRLDFCHSLMYCLPSARRTAEHVSGKACLWRKFITNIPVVLQVEMSFDDNHWWTHMMPIQFVTFCTCAVFATNSFNFGPPTYFVSHYCYRRALYSVFYRRVFFVKRKGEQNCLTMVWHMTCRRSHICWCASCWHHGFVLLVHFVLVHLKI